MTKEESAMYYLNCNSPRCDAGYLSKTNCTYCGLRKIFYKGFEEGIKSQWHDLLENPNDLPPEKEVILKCSNTYGDNHKVITDEGCLRYFIGGRYYWEPSEDESYPAGYYWYNSCTDECLDDTGYTVVGWKEF